MDRIEEILKASAEKSVECHFEDLKYFKDEIRVNGVRHFDDFYNTLKELFLEAKELQKENRKQKVMYIYFSFLNSNLLQDKYGCQINLYNKELFLDPVEVYRDLDLSFIFGNSQESIKEILRDVKSKVIRTKNYELYEVELGYKRDLYKTVEIYLIKLIPHIKKMIEYQELDKEGTVKILIGEYMDKHTIVHEIEEALEEKLI